MIANDLQVLIEEVGRGKTEGAPRVTQLLADAPAPSSRAEAPKRAAPERGAGELSAGAMIVREALAQYGGTADIAELVIMTCYAPRTISDFLSELSSSGHVTRASGRASLVVPVPAPPKPSISELLAGLYTSVSSGAAEVLRELVACKGRASTLELAKGTGFAPRTVSDHLSELSSWKLLKRANGISTLHRELGGPS